MWPGSRIDWAVSVLSCIRRARHWHLPSCGAPPHHAIRTVAAPSEQRLGCDDMPRQDSGHHTTCCCQRERDTTAQNAAWHQSGDGANNTRTFWYNQSCGETSEISLFNGACYCLRVVLTRFSETWCAILIGRKNTLASSAAA